MNKKQKLFGMAIIAIITLALASCKDKPDDPPPQQPQPYTPLYTNPATIPLSFVSASGTPAAGSFNVTIKSDDTYTPAAWDAVVANVKTALETTYASSDVTPGDRIALRDVFGVAGATVVLKNDLDKNWEVKAGVTQGVLYIKTSAVSTITASSYAAAAEAMFLNNPATSQD